MAAQDHLLSYICANQENIFSTQVRLFPPGFPSLGEQEFDQIESPSLDNLTKIVGDMEHKISLVREDMDKA
jgi:hypothetical protein